MCTKEGGWGPRLTLPPASLSWPTHKSGQPHPHPHGAPAQSTARRRKPTCRIYIPGSLQVVARQPKVFGVLVFMDIFPLNFQIFFKNKSIFLGMITQKGPVGCVCICPELFT